MCFYIVYNIVSNLYMDSPQDYYRFSVRFSIYEYSKTKFLYIFYQNVMFVITFFVDYFDCSI